MKIVTGYMTHDDYDQTHLIRSEPITLGHYQTVNNNQKLQIPPPQYSTICLSTYRAVGSKVKPIAFPTTYIARSSTRHHTKCCNIDPPSWSPRSQQHLLSPVTHPVLFFFGIIPHRLSTFILFHHHDRLHPLSSTITTLTIILSPCQPSLSEQ